jgi:hypothetical protein
MKVQIIKRQIAGIITALQNMGFRDMSQVVWLRSPVRINGVWRAEVSV